MTEVYRDGVLVTGGLTPGTWSGNQLPYPNDSENHTYEIYLVRGAMASASSFCIQPNRDGYGSDYVAELWDLKITLPL